MKNRDDVFDKLMEQYLGKYLDRIEGFYRNEMNINNDFVVISTYITLFVAAPVVILYFFVAPPSGVATIGGYYNIFLPD